MTKKKIGLIITAVALVAAVTVGGTLAWFTDTATVENTVTMGNINISMTEETTSNGANANIEIVQQAGGATITNAMPGDPITKTLEIKNDGSNDAYLRVMVTVSGMSLEEVKANVASTSADWDFDLDDAGSTDGKVVFYAYYTGNNGVFAVEGVQSPAFTTTIPSSWTASPVDGITITVQAQAIQTANLTAINAWNSFAGDTGNEAALFED